MPENQASTLGAARRRVARGRPAAAPGRGPAARGDPLRPAGRGRAPAGLARAGRRPRRLARRGQRRLHAARGRGLADRRRRAVGARGSRSATPSPRAHADPDVRIAPGSIPRPARVRYDLRPGRPDLARFPRADWVRSLSAAVRGAGVAELDYPPIAGAIPLREVVAAYRGRVRGTVARAEDVILCAGAGQAFVTIAEALGPVKLAVEDPGHEGIRGLFAKRGLEPVPTRVDEQRRRRRRAARTTRARCCSRPPTSSRPAPCSAPSGGRSCCAWAAEHDALIIEDDYDAEYRYDRAPIGALQGLRPDLVAHVGSVSKTLAPALRLGWLIAPPRVARAAARGARVARPRPARARAARARGLHHPRRLRPPPAPQRPRLPPPPRRADRGADATRCRARPSPAPPPGCTSPSTSPAPTSPRWSRLPRGGRDPRRHHPAPRRARPVRPADQLRRGARRGRRPRRGADRLSALRRRRRTACGRRARSTPPALRRSGSRGRAG